MGADISVTGCICLGGHRAQNEECSEKEKMFFHSAWG
jgi:hypothetical protein